VYVGWSEVWYKLRNLDKDREMNTWIQGGAVKAAKGRSRGRKATRHSQLPPEILLRILTIEPPGGQHPKGSLVSTHQRCGPPEPGSQDREVVIEKGRVDSSQPTAPLTVTVSSPRKPCTLPVPYWMNRGLLRFWKVEDLEGLKRW
jgi:hypothetical protein